MRLIACSVLVSLLPLLATSCRRDPPDKPTPAAGTVSVSAANVPAPSASTSASSTLAFARKALAPGLVVSIVDSSQMTMNITQPRKLDSQETEKSERRIEVVATDGGAASRVKVTYVDKAITEVADGQETTRRPAVRGKSYIVEQLDGKLVVTDAARTAARKEEVDIVAADFAQDLGKPDRMVASVPEAPLRVGDPVGPLAEWVRDELSKMGDGIEIKSCTVALRAVKNEPNGKVGAFSVKTTLSMKPRGVTITMDLEGELAVREDGRPLALDLGGPLVVKGGGAEGTGKVSVQQKRDYP